MEAPGTGDRVQPTFIAPLERCWRAMEGHSNVPPLNTAQALDSSDGLAILQILFCVQPPPWRRGRLGSLGAQAHTGAR